jgi:hypothetical protein
MIMKTKTMFAIVALPALSLGTGTAMAQNETASDSGVPYWTLERQADAHRYVETRDTNRVRAGSTDIEAPRFGVGHVLPFNGDYSTLANPN